MGINKPAIWQKFMFDEPIQAKLEISYAWFNENLGHSHNVGPFWRVCEAEE